MANTLIREIKSVNIGIVSDTSNAGTLDEGFVFGSGGTDNLIGSAANGRVITATGSTADVTESWTITLIVPEGFKFRRTTTVTTAAGGNVTGAHYSDAMDSDGNVTVTFIANAEDTGGAIANAEVVTVAWQAYDETTFHATMFSVKCQSSNNGHSASVIVRFTEGGDPHTIKLFCGDSLLGPFSEVEVDSVSNTDTTVFVYYQEH